MTKKEYLINKYKEQYSQYLANKMDFICNPSIARIEPFRIADGLYYVGDKKVCIHLIDTGAGLILIDSGYLGAEHILVDNIWRAGFDPKEIKIIIHTHGHSDHYGASDEFKKMYGCKLAISEIDAKLVKKRALDGNIGGELHPLAKAPEFDIEIKNGDIIELGNTKIRCVLTPGHTEGVISLFFKVTFEGKTYTAGLFGGVGTNALKLTYLYYNDSPKKLPEMMLDSIEKMRMEEVEIHLGNHPTNNHTLEKRNEQIEKGGNPFINKSSWGELLDSLEERVKQIIIDNDKLNNEINKILK